MRDYDDVKADRAVAEHDAAEERLTRVNLNLHDDLWSVYQMPQGDWGAVAGAVCTDGFTERQDALLWVTRRLALALDRSMQWERNLSEDVCRFALEDIPWEQGEGLHALLREHDCAGKAS